MSAQLREAVNDDVGATTYGATSTSSSCNESFFSEQDVLGPLEDSHN